VLSQDEQIAHELHIITLANNRETAPPELFALHFYEFVVHRGLNRPNRPKPKLPLDDNWCLKFLYPKFRRECV
jgi:hypothetical protein